MADLFLANRSLPKIFDLNRELNRQRNSLIRKLESVKLEDLNLEDLMKMEHKNDSFIVTSCDQTFEFKFKKEVVKQEKDIKFYCNVLVAYKIINKRNDELEKYYASSIQVDKLYFDINEVAYTDSSFDQVYYQGNVNPVIPIINFIKDTITDFYIIKEE